ncbi:kinase-like domain-containing protein [Rhizophagus clarus]|uniref:Kinase-like domain-containing protein n=1 Tax=Rhizophagus clarus TaxID=94130 RepID=A0A8H3KTJ8_9GLOM|nr:kinase-like domain-containing protein [Rhizophagus clarus]
MSYQDDLCKKCGEKYMNKYDTEYKWCKACQISNIKQNFANWTSKNEQIDNLIQEMQLEINEPDDMIFEWIPYDQFDSIEEISEGSDKVYLAIWKDGPLDYDKYKNEYIRSQQDKKVALKLYNKQNIINEFFIEQDKKYSITYIGEVLRIHGISQYSNTENYIIVFQDIYCKKCGKRYINIIEKWCEPCQINYFKENLFRSGNENIDNIIQKMQLNINYKSEIVFEWIPYDQLNNIQEKSKNDLDIMYSATWKNGPLCYYEGKWVRKSDKVVMLKYLYNSQNIIKFLNMVDYVTIKNSKLYGISQNPDTEDYIMVFPNIYCKICNEQYESESDANYEWCKLCKEHNLEQNFTNWTTGYEKIDKVIQEKQLAIYSMNNTIWKDGPLNYDKYKNEYTRNQRNIKVSLKIYNVQNITKRFLNEVKEDGHYNNKIFGISQSPSTKNYITILQDEYNKICNKCGEDKDAVYNWCMLCHINYLRKIFINWTSGNKKIDNFVQERQLETKYIDDKIFEFIPYNQFNNIKEMNKNSFVTIYSAIWKNGPLSCHNKKWIRESNKKVILELYHLQNTNKFLNKVKNYLNKKSMLRADNPIYGISQNQDTKYCAIVSPYDYYCKRCGKQYLVYNYYYQWCVKCQVSDLKSNFTNWTSGNEEIDNLIQKVQSNIKDRTDMVFEWIPYDQFTSIKNMNNSKFTKMYSAIWKNDFYYYKYLYKMEQVKQLTLKVILKYSQNIIEEVKGYSSFRKKYGISQNPITKDYFIVFESEYCDKCDEKYTDINKNWCKPCQKNNLSNNFTNWTSKNMKIDNLIQEIQLKVNDPDDRIFEWIPFDQFSSIEEIGKGGFATIYSAIWKDGPLSYNGYEYIRNKKKTKIALKQLYDSQNITTDFLNEVKRYSIKENNILLLIYGISLNPDTKDYIMVLEYAEGGNLYSLINQCYYKLYWSYNISILLDIIGGLKEIHDIWADLFTLH